MISRKTCPYTGTLGSTETKHRSTAPSIEALKRALARLGYMQWKGSDFTGRWPDGGELDKAFRQWQQDEEMPADGIYGEQAWKQLRAAKVPQGRPNAGKNALDAYACKLIRADWAEQNVPDEVDVRRAITAFCLAAERNEDAWHYRMARPVDVSVDPKARYIWSDCSGFTIQCFHAARATGVNVPDPGGYDYSGYGNTDSMDGHPRVSTPYRIGDLAHYSGHVTVCRRGGTSTTSIWTSHGQEAGPIPTNLHYRSDLRFVCRPPLK